MRCKMLLLRHKANIHSLQHRAHLWPFLTLNRLEIGCSHYRRLLVWILLLLFLSLWEVFTGFLGFSRFQTICIIGVEEVFGLELFSLLYIYFEHFLFVHDLLLLFSVDGCVMLFHQRGGFVGRPVVLPPILLALEPLSTIKLLLQTSVWWRLAQVTARAIRGVLWQHLGRLFGLLRVIEVFLDGYVEVIFDCEQIRWVLKFHHQCLVGVFDWFYCVGCLRWCVCVCRKSRSIGSSGGGRSVVNVNNLYQHLLELVPFSHIACCSSCVKRSGIMLLQLQGLGERVRRRLHGFQPLRRMTKMISNLLLPLLMCSNGIEVATLHQVAACLR